MITPNVIEREWVQGCNVHVENLTGTAFSGENGAHTFKIRGVDADGQPVAIAGTVLAKILRADNVTVDVAGSVVDGVAEVTMVGDCYHVPGRASIVIFLSDGTNTVTLYAAVFNVYRSTSGNEIDSGVNIPSLAELLAQIERMETATAAAIEATEATEAAISKTEHLLDTSETTAWNQLNANSGATSTASGVTFTNNGDGTWTLTGNGTGAERKLISAVSLNVGHVYAVLNGGIDTTDMNAYVCVTKNGTSLKAFNTENLFTADNDYNQFNIRTLSGFTAPEGGLEFAPMLIDLTDIYGEGLEPSTIAEFRTKYPHRIYPYADIGSVRNLDITEVHGAQIAELQDDLDDANTAITANATAITALDTAKADKAELAHTNRVVSALVEAGKGKVLRFETDDDDAYAKSVPSGALNATVTEWGGKSVVWNNWVNWLADKTYTNNGITVDVDATNHRVHVYGTATADASVITINGINFGSLVRHAHKYYLSSTSPVVFGDGNGRIGVTAPSQEKVIITRTENDGAVINSPFIKVNNGTTVDTYVQPKLVDLTQLYGAGNEPTTTDDPRIAAIEAYAAEHPAYNAGEIVNADVNAIITKKADTTTMQTVNIPSAVLAQYPLRSAGTVYDTISFDGEKWWHTQRIKSIDCSQYEWTPFQRDDAPFFYTTGTVDATTNRTNVASIFGAIVVSQNGYTIRIGLPNGTDLSTVTVAGIVLYDASTPVVTDITDLMGTAGTDLIAMAVESGGTITFAQNGDTIFPVPNTIEYTVKISEVE